MQEIKLRLKTSDVKTGSVNSLVTAKWRAYSLKATITVDSENRLNLKARDSAYFIFKAPSVIIQKIAL